ncbi:MAG TPA: molecular chaperone TorD family protein [Euzebyales bacterium]|nr:molecular chaperone TorD family protein [Euzebyales bacterium]
MELLRALGALAEEPGPAHEPLAALLHLPRAPDAAAFTDCFMFNLYPYASVYLGAEGKLGGAARDRVAGFFRALGAVPDTEPDHLTLLVTAYGQLRDVPADGPAGHAAAALLHEHLVPWLPLYLARVRALAPAPYPQWAQVLADVLLADAGGVADAVDPPLHLRDAPALPDPRAAGHDAFVDGLLSPVRAGVILTGRDLLRASRELRLGLRVGERRFVLDALLAQDAAATLRWLAGHTRTTGDAWAPWTEVAPTTATWWSTRADATLGLLHELALEVDGVHPAEVGG